MLVSSEVQGKIHEPSFYFKKDEPKAEKALDYLLMTQGWRGFDWQKITDANIAEWDAQIVYSPEKAILKGKAVKGLASDAIANAKVTVVETEQVIYTDTAGKFEFDDLDLSSPLTLQIIAEDGKQRLVQVNDYAQEYIVKNTLEGVVIDGTTGEPLILSLIHI